MGLLSKSLILLLLTQSALAQVVLQKTVDLPGQYIVEFRSINVVSTREIAAKKGDALRVLRDQQKSNIDQLIRDTSDTDLKIIRNLWIKQSVAITISDTVLPQLRALPYVREVRADAQYQAKDLSIVTLGSGEIVQDNLNRVDIDPLWAASYQGQGVVVAILDSGVDVLHEDLASRWRAGTNSWFDPYKQQLVPTDITGHGTAVASIVLGGNATGSYTGVAPEAQWIAARIFDDNGQSTESAISETLQWVVDPDGDSGTDDAPDIVQNSWGLAFTEGKCINPFSTELATIDALGIDIVFAVGNSGGSGASTFLTPAFDSHVISVGALRIPQASPGPVDILLFSSSRGPDTCNAPVTIIPSVVAPGENIKSADLTFNGFDTDNTKANTGSSFSAPHVSGALALLRSKYNVAAFGQYRQAIFDSAIDLGSAGDDSDYGYGLIQVSAAEALLTAQSASAVSARSQEVSFSAAKYVFSESEANASISILRSGDTSTAASVNISSTNGTAIGDKDFQLIPVLTVLSFAAGESVKRFTISLIDDAQSEGSESFGLTLSGNTNVNLGTKTSLSITITDDDGSSASEGEIGGGSFGLFNSLIICLLLVGRRLRI